MKWIDTTLTLLGRILMWCAGLCLILMMVQVASDVVGRIVFGRPLPSTIEIVAEWWMPALIFLPMVAVALKGENISVDIVYELLPVRGRALSDIFAGLAFAVFIGFVSWGAAEQALRAYDRGEYIMGMMPVVIWPARFFLPVSGALTLVLYLLLALRAALRQGETRHG